MDGHSRQRHERLSIALALAIMVVALVMAVVGIAGVSPVDIADRLYAAPEDGSWKATTFDRRPVESKNYLIAVRRGKVIGGYDDCNGWSYQDSAPGRNGERKVLSTLVSCSGDDELRQLYRMLVYGPRIELLGRSALRLTRARHEGIFHRCKPERGRLRCNVE